MLMLCTTDGSHQSLHVLPHAAAFARAAGMEIALSRVYEHESPGNDDADEKRALHAALSEHGIAGRVIVARRGRDEDTASAIARVATESGAALIAMDSRGVGALRHAIFGSTAINVLRKTPCPVFVTGPATGPASTADPYRLAITTDGSPASRAAFVKLGPILESSCMPVSVIGVYVPALADAPLTIELERSEATCRAAQAMLPGCIPSSVGVVRAEEFERTEHAIVRAAHEAGASAIAMGTHGRGRSLHLFLGSVALGTVERSDLPVILCGQ
jgi:nucleotide-binding universal stress UspA family protein